MAEFEVNHALRPLRTWVSIAGDHRSTRSALCRFWLARRKLPIASVTRVMGHPSQGGGEWVYGYFIPV